MNAPLFLWQPDESSYQLMCRHLGLTPIENLHRRLSDHLGQLAFTHKPPQGLALHLARLRPGRLRLAWLDVITRLWFPDHPVRQQLNAMVALHESHPQGYRELGSVPRGWRTWPFLARLGFEYGITLATALPWLGWQAARSGFGRTLAPLAQLQDRKLLITGVGRGLGRDLMLTALQLGAQVVGIVRNEKDRQKLRDELPETAPLDLVVLDLADPEAAVAALEEAGVAPDTIDLMVLCAGVKRETSVLDSAALKNTFQVNFFANAALTGWYLEARPDGRLVVISSMGRWHGMGGTGGYNASKAALSIWAESLEMETGRRGDSGRILVVEPGLFTSGMTTDRGLAGRLAVDRRDLALRILAASCTNRRTLRPPAWFAAATWGLLAAGRGVRNRFLARARETRDS